MAYDLVFVLLWDDVNLPLVFSQTFDQAQIQSELSGSSKPDSVSVWIITPFRFFLGKKEQQLISKLRSRCQDVLIKLVPEINRLNNFPSRWFLNFYRGDLKGRGVVFHFRGESTFLHFNVLYTRRKSDVFILDVRGYWPAELLYARGIEDVSTIPPEFQELYKKSTDTLCEALRISDGVVTVSENLAGLLRELFPGIGDINIIPCCIRSLNDRKNRTAVRQLLGIKDEESLLVYCGGYARYQHLEDLTIPFFKLLLKLNSTFKVLILSQDIEKIQKIVTEVADSTDRFLFRKAEQAEVGDYLSACDLGFLLRKENLVNQVAQPVKVGEYLASGVPVCVEGEVGGVTSILANYHAGISIKIAGNDEAIWYQEAERVLQFLTNDHNKQAKGLALDYFSWDKNVLRQRNYYLNILNQK